MKYSRRSFMGVAAAGALGTSGGLLSSFSAAGMSAAEAKKKAVLKISLQEGLTPGNSLGDKLDYMESLGVVGIEPGGGGLWNRVEEYQKALQNRDVKVSAICAGFEGWLIAEDPAIRKKCMASMKQILEAAGAIGSTGLIFVPAFNSQVSLPHKEARAVLIDQLKELSEFALQHKTRVLLEPLNRGECYFCRQVADAAAISKDVGSEGAAVIGDFWHMTWEETSDRGAFISAGDYLHHVHIASRKSRNTPGEDGEADNYIDGFRGLKEIGFQDYISFECGSKGKREDTIPAAVKLIKEQWKKA